MYNGDVSFYI